MNKDYASKLLQEVYRESFTINKYAWIDQHINEIIQLAVSCAAQVIFGEQGVNTLILPELGEITFPFTSFGNVTSVELFNISELALFQIYKKISTNYDIALDLGANIGLHSIMMSRAGFKQIIAIEADGSHLPRFEENLKKNDIDNCQIRNLAISDSFGEVTFTRLIGNLTGSHVKGSKNQIYGETQEITVVSVPVQSLVQKNLRTFVKMDIEGHEAKAILSIPEKLWLNMDICLELGSQNNATLIFEYTEQASLNIFCEKTGWNIAKSPSELPVSWRDGSILISRNQDFFEFMRPT